MTCIRLSWTLRLDPGVVQIEADQYGLPIYKETGSTQRTIPRADIFHLRGPALNGIKGDSPVTQARDALGLAILLERHAAQLFARGARPSGVIETPGDVPETTIQKMLAGWRAAHEGADNGGRTAFLFGGSRFNPLTFSSVDAQFLELRKFAISEIARIWRVPPVLLMDYERQTWANAETGGQQFLTYTLMPWIRRWESEISIKLIGDPRHYAEFQTDSLLRADFATRMAGYSTAISARILNPNEARAAENRPRFEGGDEFVNPHITAAPAATTESANAN